MFFIPLGFAFSESDSSGITVQYEGYSSGTASWKTVYHDLTKLDFEIVEVNKFPIPTWIDEPGDFSDILQIKFNATNNGLTNFVIYKDMFQIDVIDPNKQYYDVRRTKGSLIDNYYPQYIEDFKLRFQDVRLPESVFECELLNHSIQVNQTKTLSVCFDVKQKWANRVLDFDGDILYYLVMMDNKQVTSCPNCKVTLLNEHYHDERTNLIVPDKTPANIKGWLEKLNVWVDSSLISNKDYNLALEFLEEKGIIAPKKIESSAKKQTILKLVQFSDSRFNEGSPIVFEGRLLDVNGNPISDAIISIKSDGTCPADKIIAKGITDKHGRYKIFTKALLWDERDGMVTAFAEFTGSHNLKSSVSNPQIIVVYSVTGEKCQM